MDKFWAALSSLDFWMPFLILAALLILWRGGFRARAMLLCLLLSIGIMEGLVTNPLKSAFGRPRPINFLTEARSVNLASVTPRFLALAHPVRIKPSKVASPPKPGKSFPSGHTANMFCFATILAAFYWKRGLWFFIPAFLVAISRIFTGSHWPSDVLFSALLSVITTLVLLEIYKFLWAKLAPKFLSRLAANHPKLIV